MNGPNELNALNEKLMLHASRGEIRSGQSGLVSTKIDASPSSTTFDVQMSGMAAIFPMDYVRSRLANFESKVYLPEDPGVVQVENFGIHLHANGQVVFGVIVDSVQSHVKDGIPVDLVARLVFDLHEDSSSTLESISSSHQRLLMTSLRSKKSKKVAGADNHASAHGATMSVVDLGARTERRTRRSKKAGGGGGGGRLVRVLSAPLRGVAQEGEEEVEDEARGDAPRVDEARRQRQGWERRGRRRRRVVAVRLGASHVVFRRQQR